MPEWEDAATALRRAAMDYLARREHSLHELRLKLQRRFPEQPPEAIDRVTGALRDEGLQSDERFVESYVRYRKQRGFAYRHIRRDLLQRQAAPALIDRHLRPDDPDWPPLLQSLIHSRLGITAGSASDAANLEFGSREHRRLLRFLEGRGFPISDIIKSLQPCLSSPSGIRNETHQAVSRVEAVSGVGGAGRRAPL